MSIIPTQDTLSGIAAQTTVHGTTLTPFAAATVSGSNDDTDVVTCYVLNDNPSAGTLDASALPAGCCIAPAGGTLVMISGTVATVQTALRALQFDASPLAAGTTQSAHLTIVMSNVADGVSSARAITASIVQNVGVNVAVQGIPTSGTVADNATSAPFSQAVVVSASNDGVSVTVSLSDATLGSFNTSALSGVTVTSGANGSVTLTGTAASVGAGLDTLQFSPVAALVGTTAKEVFTVTATDRVNGTSVSATDTLSIAGSQSAVSLSGVAATASMDGGGSVAPFSTLSVQDKASGSVVATVTLGSPAAGSFDLTALPLTSSGGVTSSVSTDGGTLVLTGAAASVEADLQALRFVAANPASGTTIEAIGLTVATAANGSAAATETLTIASSGSAPVLSGAATTLQMSGQTAQLYPGIVLSGPTTEVDATISLSDPSVATFNQTAFTEAESGNAAISFSFAADGSTLRIEGSAADVDTALREVGLVASTPATGVRSQDVATLTVKADAGVASAVTTVSVDGPTLLADSLSSVASTVAGTEGQTVLPFAQAVIADPNVGDTVTATISSSVAGVFDTTTLGSGATLSADGSTVSISGTAASVKAALNSLAVRVPQTGAGGSVALTVQLTNQAGSAASLSTAAITETIRIVAPAFTGSPATDRVFAVSSDPSATATLDLSSNPNTDIVVFGGNAALNLRAANTVVVLNGANQNGAVQIESLGNDMVWVGSASVDCTAGGHDRFVLGNAAPGVSSTVTLHGGTAADTSEFDVWGDSSEVQTITTDGVSTSTVFAGGAALDFTGGNATLVMNGEGQTGAVTIHSLGGNTVWAGTAQLDVFEGAGNDTIILGGSAATTIHGATVAQSGTTTVMSFGNTGQFTYEGGDKSAMLSLSGGSNTVDAGSAAQAITMAGGGSLLVSDSMSATGAQQITMAQGSTATLQFLGGSNPAMLVLGAGAATIDAGTKTTITGGSGTATVDLSHAVGAALSFNGALSGAVDITGFDPTRASVELSHVAGSTVQNGSLVVSFTDGAEATFQGYTDPNHAGISFG